MFIEYIQTYPYFFSQMVALAILLLIISLIKRNRNVIILGGLLALPQALCSIFLIPNYWSPNLVLAIKPGIEDYLFCFLTGAFVMLIMSRYIKSIPTEFKSAFGRFLICYGISVAFIGTFILLGYMNIYITLFFMLLWSLFMFNYYIKYRKIILKTVFWFFGMYVIVFILLVRNIPDFGEYWLIGKTSGIHFLNIPIEELGWSLLYPFSWAGALLFILQLQPLESKLNYRTQT